VTTYAMVSSPERRESRALATFAPRASRVLVTRETSLTGNDLNRSSAVYADRPSAGKMVSLNAFNSQVANS
jgi:hypothetical protein